MKKIMNYSLLIVLFSFITFSCSKTDMDDLSATMSQDNKTLAKTKMDTPMLSCVSSTQTSISIKVKAGASGALAGFSLQWMTADDFAANNGVWYLSDDPRLCKGSFSGSANLSRYNLGANEEVTVKVGDFLIDQGASTNCGSDLVCGKTYVFRAFAHANSSLNRSDFTPNLECSTLPCRTVTELGCTYTQGYWKSHGPIPTGNNENEWPVRIAPMTLGTVPYTDLQLLNILRASPGGNGLIALAHQLIAAKLNIANGADRTSINLSIIAADDLINSLVIPPVGIATMKSSATSALTDALASFNEGGVGHPGHCDSE